jgi:hypothetical protein
VENPILFKDKEVVLEGHFGGVCCGSDFFYKEGLLTIEAYPRDFNNPKCELGNPIRVYGTVKVMEKIVEAQKGVEQNEYHISIVARGLEVK